MLMPMSQSPLAAPARRLAAALLALAACAAGARGQTTLSSASPFAPTGAAAAGVAAPAEAYELAGSSVEGSTVLVCIYDRQAKHTEWIPVGGFSGTLHVISFDRQHDRVVVTIGGEKKELALRSASAVAAEPAAAAAPLPPAVAPAHALSPVPAAPAAAPATTASLAHDQNEARMLV